MEVTFKTTTTAMSRLSTRHTTLINRFYSTIFSCSTCFERITHSSGALPDILHHAVWYNRAVSSILDSAPVDERAIRSKHVEQEKTVE